MSKKDEVGLKNRPGILIKIKNDRHGYCSRMLAVLMALLRISWGLQIGQSSVCSSSDPWKQPQPSKSWGLDAT